MFITLITNNVEHNLHDMINKTHTKKLHASEYLNNITKMQQKNVIMLQLTVTYHLWILLRHFLNLAQLYYVLCVACVCNGKRGKRQKECEISFLQIYTNFTSGIILLLFDIKFNKKEHKICMFTMVYRHVQVFIYRFYYTRKKKVRRSRLKYTWIYVNILLQKKTFCNAYTCVHCACIKVQSYMTTRSKLDHDFSTNIL